MPQNDVVTLKNALTYSGIQGGTAQVALPNAWVEKLDLFITYTVTDAGISAGETFQGLIDEMFIGNDSYKIIEARRDELSVLADLLHDGSSTGVYSDPQPTTATQQRAHYTLEGPFDLRVLDQAFMRLALRDVTDEFGGASAFVATVTVVAHIGEPEAGEYGLILRRAQGASATDHALQVPAINLAGVHLVTGSGDVLSRFAIPQAGLQQPDPYAAHTTWASHKNSAPDSSPTQYLVLNFFHPSEEGRRLEAELSSAATLKAYFIGLEA